MRTLFQHESKRIIYALQILSKYDANLEADAVQWIEAILGEGTMKGAEGPDQVQKVLKDGSILCK